MQSSGWRPWRRSLLSDRGRVVQLTKSDTSMRLMVQGNGTYAAIGSNLHALDQCGGAGGLCNSTTIGIPCGDHVWQSVSCPQNFTCARRNASFWQCQLIPGRTVPKDASIVAATVAVTVLPTTDAASSGKESGHAGGGKSSGTPGASQEEPVVPVCGPGATGNAMCNKTVSGYILPLDQMPPQATSAAGLSRGGGSTALQLLQLVAAVLAVAAAAAQPG